MYLARLATVLGRHDDATSLFERADAQLRALRAPFWQARNQVVRAVDRDPCRQV